MKPMKQCNHVTCRRLIPFDQGYCNQHIKVKAREHKLSRREINRSYDDKRKQEAPHIHAFYQSKRWEKLSRQVKVRDDFMCQECLRNNQYTPADVTDHIIEIKDDWDNGWNTKTMESLCHDCHNFKTRRESKKRKT